MQGITQVIDAQNGSVQNIAEFRIASAVNGCLNVAGTVEPVQQEGNSAEVIRVDVGFTSFSIKLGILPALSIPLTWPKTPKVRIQTHNALLCRQLWLQACLIKSILLPPKSYPAARPCRANTLY